MGTANSVMIQLFENFPAFTQQWEKYPFMVNLYSVCHMKADLHSVKPMNSLADLKGKVVAAQSDGHVKAINALGGSATLMLGSDAYLALQNKVVDAAMGAWGWTNIWKIYEVAPYHVLIGISPGVASYAMRTEIFNKFTPEEQGLLMDYWRGPALLREWRGNVWEVEVVKSKIPRENYILWPQADMDTMRVKFRPMWDEWADEMEALGYPGYDILDYTVKWIDLYNQA